MSDLSYFKKRKAKRMFEYMQSAEETADVISQIYYQSSVYLNSQLEQVFHKYQSKHQLSKKEAYALLNTLHDKTSLKELKQALSGSTDSKEKKQILATLESPAYRFRLERLQNLQTDIDSMMKRIYRQEKKYSTIHYIDLANSAYYHSIFDIQHMVGFRFDFTSLNPEDVEKVLHSKWVGENYSSRIWANTSALAESLKTELIISLLTGRTDKETADLLSVKFAQSASNARRLVRTESAYVANELEMQSYEECGIEFYRFVSLLDMRTSEVCRSLDGKRFRVAKRQPGENAPPMHPWCRSTTICDISDAELRQMKRRARNPETGKNELIPANINYKEWYSQVRQAG